MSYSYLIKNSKLFQGEKRLKNNCKNYFEGWYFKHSNGSYGISFIPGINIENGSKNAFIQVITNDNSYFIKCDFNDFKFSHDPFYIRIGDNYFSDKCIYLNILDISQSLRIFGKLSYDNNTNIKSTALSPNIMGPFSYLSFIECNHAIISMKSSVSGFINLNNQFIDFTNGFGYLEKDWGLSFPKSYVWCEANNFNNSDSSFFFSMADIPFKLFHFKGFICTLIYNSKEFRFSTYNNSSIKKFNINDNIIDISLKKGKYILNISSKILNSLELSAPIKGSMCKPIYESINSIVYIQLIENNKIIYSDTSFNCGIEVVK